MGLLGQFSPLPVLLLKYRVIPCYDTITRCVQFRAWLSCTVFMHDEQVISKKDVNIMIVVRIAYLNKHNTDVPFSLSYTEVR